MNGSVDYSRLAATGFENSVLRNLRALIVGAGALGNEVSKTLGLLGIGRMTIVDPDLIEPHNLTRSVLFRSDTSIGCNKAEVLATAMNRQFPDTSATSIPAEIADVGFAYLSSHDILFSCVDSDLARLEIAYIAHRLRLPVADAGLGAEEYSRGRVSYFPGGEGPCYGCLLPPQRRRELLTAWEATVHSCWSPATAGKALSSTPTMSAITAAMQVEIGLRRILEPTCSIDGFSCEIRLHPVQSLERCVLQRCECCPFHGYSSPLVPAPGLCRETTVRDLFAACHSGTLVLDWPMCVGARCLGCGHRWRPRVRLAVFRRGQACPACGSRAGAEEEVLRSVSRGDASTGWTLEEIGLPEGHLYSFRQASA